MGPGCDLKRQRETPQRRRTRLEPTHARYAHTCAPPSQRRSALIRRSSAGRILRRRRRQSQCRRRWKRHLCHFWKIHFTRPGVCFVGWKRQKCVQLRFKRQKSSQIHSRRWKSPKTLPGPRHLRRRNRCQQTHSSQQPR